MLICVRVRVWRVARSQCVCKRRFHWTKLAGIFISVVMSVVVSFEFWAIPLFSCDSIIMEGCTI